MATYRIEPLGIELINPTIEKVTPTYTVGGDFVEVYASLKVDGMNPKSVYMGQMENTDSWGDEEVMKFATKQLETFKI